MLRNLPMLNLLKWGSRTIQSIKRAKNFNQFRIFNGVINLFAVTTGVHHITFTQHHQLLRQGRLANLSNFLNL